MPDRNDDKTPEQPRESGAPAPESPAPGGPSSAAAKLPPPPVAKPRRVPAAEPAPTVQKHGRWFVALVAAVALIAAIIVAAVAVSAMKDNGPTQDEQIRESIDVFSTALATGDIQTLRTSSCGPLRDYYLNIPDEQFAEIYTASVEQKNIPVIESIDAIQVTDNTAIAQVTAYTNAAPLNKSARTFNLENSDQGWKVCDPPA